VLQRSGERSFSGQGDRQLPKEGSTGWGFLKASAQDCLLPGFVTPSAFVDSNWMRKTKRQMATQLSMHLCKGESPHH